MKTVIAVIVSLMFLVIPISYGQSTSDILIGSVLQHIDGGVLLVVINGGKLAHQDSIVKVQVTHDPWADDDHIRIRVIQTDEFYNYVDMDGVTRKVKVFIASAQSSPHGGTWTPL